MLLLLLQTSGTKFVRGSKLDKTVGEEEIDLVAQVWVWVARMYEVRIFMQ